MTPAAEVMTIVDLHITTLFLCSATQMDGRMCVILPSSIILITLTLHSSYDRSGFTQGARHGGATDYAPDEHTHHRRLPVERPYGTHHRRLPVDGDYLVNDYDYIIHFDPAVEEDWYNEFMGEDGIFPKSRCMPNEEPLRSTIGGYLCVPKTISRAGCPAGNLKTNSGNCRPAPKGGKPKCPGGTARACWPKRQLIKRVRGMRREHDTPFWTCKSTCKQSTKYVDFDYDA